MEKASNNVQQKNRGEPDESMMAGRRGLKPAGKTLSSHPSTRILEPLFINQNTEKRHSVPRCLERILKKRFSAFRHSGSFNQKLAAELFIRMASVKKAKNALQQSGILAVSVTAVADSDTPSLDQALTPASGKSGGSRRSPSHDNHWSDAVGLQLSKPLEQAGVGAKAVTRSGKYCIGRDQQSWSAEMNQAGAAVQPVTYDAFGVAIRMQPAAAGNDNYGIGTQLDSHFECPLHVVNGLFEGPAECPGEAAGESKAADRQSVIVEDFADRMLTDQPRLLTADRNIPNSKCGQFGRFSQQFLCC